MRDDEVFISFIFCYTHINANYNKLLLVRPKPSRKD